MKTTIAKTFLALVLVMPTTMQAYERGQSGTLRYPACGRAHPEGICVDREGNVYVVTVAAEKPQQVRHTARIRLDRQAPADLRIAGSSRNAAGTSTSIRKPGNCS